MKTKWNWVCSKGQRMYYNIKTKSPSFLAFLSTLVLIVSLWLSVSMAVIYFQMSSGQELFSSMDKTVTLLLEWFGITGEYRYENLSTLINIFLGFSGVLLSFYTVLSYWRKNRAIEKNLPISSVPVFEDGKDDINVMREYYREASEITVFSGSFQWIAKDTEILNTFVRLAKNETLYLFTSRDVDVVKNNLLDGCPPELKQDLDIIARRINSFSRTQSNDELKCSYVKRNQTKYVLYKYETDSIPYVYVIKPKAGAEYLLRAFGILISDIINTASKTTP